MSFRHTAITEFLYKRGRDEELATIVAVLAEYGHFEWCGGSDESNKQLGYFHGVIKDLDGHETKATEQTIIDDVFKRADVRIKIVLE